MKSTSLILSSWFVQVVFKIVPLEGSLLVNGEVQKSSAEIVAEVAIALTLSRLRDTTGLICNIDCFAPSSSYCRCHWDSCPTPSSAYRF